MAIALAIGIPFTIAAGRAMAAHLFGVKPYDPRILLLTTAALVVAAFLAAVVPARRAATQFEPCARNSQAYARNPWNLGARFNRHFRSAQK
jgi:hypothetical protein